MEMSGQLDAPAALLRGKRAPRTNWIGWVGPRSGLDYMEYRKSLGPAGNRTPAVQPVAIPTEARGIFLLARIGLPSNGAQ
jgi:hypothetical protein